MSAPSRPGSAHLAMRPQGIAGRLFGVVMERLNAPAYRLALDMIAPFPTDAILEIGFGTGRLIELLLARAPDGRVAGVDPTPTMLDVARGRRAVRAAGARVDLRLGDASRLPWPDASFDAVAALHCFQFWTDPLASAREIGRVLRPNGRLVLILRTHSRDHAPAWLPNPISRTANEVEGARACLVAAGLLVAGADAWPPAAVLATRPAA